VFGFFLPSSFSPVLCPRLARMDRVFSFPQFASDGEAFVPLFFLLPRLRKVESEVEFEVG